MRLFKILTLVASLTVSAFAGYDFSLPGANGGTVSFSQFRGQVLIVDFFASWCGPCKESFKAYNSLKSKYNFAIVAVSEDASPADAQKFASDNGGSAFNIAMDSSHSVAGAYGATPPTAYLFDKSGNLLKTFRGFRPGDETELENALKEATK